MSIKKNVKLLVFYFDIARRMRDSAAMNKTKCVTISLPTDVYVSARNAARKAHKKLSEWFRDAALAALRTEK